MHDEEIRNINCKPCVAVRHNDGYSNKWVLIPFSSWSHGTVRRLFNAIGGLAFSNHWTTACVCVGYSALSMAGGCLSTTHPIQLPAGYPKTTTLDKYHV